MNLFYTESDKDPENKEQGLLDYVRGLSEERVSEVRNKPRKVLEVIDEYCATDNGLNNIGKFKGEIVVDQIKKTLPKLTIELGSYIGYSTIFFASEIFDICHYVSFEENEEYAKISRELIELAGLSDRVEIIVGKASNKLVEFSNDDPRAEKGVNFIYIDHDHNSYLSDLKLIESLQLIRPDNKTTITANNIKSDGIKDYLNYVRNNEVYESSSILSIDPWGREDGIEISKYKNN